MNVERRKKYIFIASDVTFTSTSSGKLLTENRKMTDLKGKKLFCER